MASTVIETPKSRLAHFPSDLCLKYGGDTDDDEGITAAAGPPSPHPIATHKLKVSIASPVLYKTYSRNPNSLDAEFASDADDEREY